MKLSLKIRYIFSIFISLTLISCSHNPGSQLSLFEGTWKMETDENSIFEEWEKVSDSLCIGMSYLVNDGDTIVLETLQLKYENGKLCYAPTVQTQNEGREILFPLKEFAADEKKFVFENLAHDFPQRIIYHFVDDKTLNARIEGMEDGRMENSDFNYKKQ